MCAPDQYILVVDDDESIRDALCEVLADLGHNAECVSNGKEALERLSRGTLPQLVLLDLMMPVMDGWAFRERQLADPRLAGLPVYVLTAAGRHVRPSPVETEFLLTKPIGLAPLEAVLNRHCQGRPAA